MAESATSAHRPTYFEQRARNEFDAVASPSPDEKLDEMATPRLVSETPAANQRAGFKVYWDSAVQRGVVPRLVYSGVALLLFLIWFIIMLVFTRDQINYEKVNIGDTPQRHNDDENLLHPGAIGLKGTFINFDPVAHSLAITWSGIFKLNGSTDWVDLGDPYSEQSWTNPEGLAIYQDVSAQPWDYIYNNANATVITNGTFALELQNNSNDPNIVLAYQYRVDNLTAPTPIAVIGKHTWDSFDTDIGFTTLKPLNVWSAPQIGYPFDQWSGSIVFVASDLAWAQNTRTPGGGVFELANVHMSDSTLNWRFSYTFNDTCYSKNGWDWKNKSSFNDSCYLQVNLIAKRPSMVMFAAMAAVIVNWVSAAFIFVLTAEAIVLRRSKMLDGTDLLGVCFTALFALPTIRALLPGAPDYGCTLDLVGVLPATLLVALCTVGVSVAKLSKRRKEEKVE